MCWKLISIQPRSDGGAHLNKNESEEFRKILYGTQKKNILIIINKRG